MALQTALSFRGALYPEAYIMVRKVAIDKAEGCLGTVFVYASDADRLAGRPPIDQFTASAPYSDAPYKALYSALKEKYPGAVDV